MGPPPRPRPTAPTRRALAAGVVLLGLVAAGLAGCGDDDGGDEARVALVDSLGFLADDFGLTEAQVRCVAEEIEAGAGDEALDALAEAVRSVDAGEATLADLPPAQGRAVTAAIEACAVAG